MSALGAVPDIRSTRNSPLKQPLIYPDGMCGRVIQSSRLLRLAIVEGLDVSDNRMGNIRPRYNAAPSQELILIRQNQGEIRSVN